uniref:Uncharacterized protein n=1 Tax=Panagrolaimus sp. ES5 TaxID=591445 RepID=A0AC34F0L6_9BILA
MRRVSKRSHALKKSRKFQENYATDGVIFRQKSLLNKRGSECFSVGTCIIRLQDFSDNFNTFNNTVWTVANHNLIRKYEHISSDGLYECYKPTDRYTRWLPHFPNDYISIDDVISIEDNYESRICVRLPSRERIVATVEASTRDRLAKGLPPVAPYDPTLFDQERSQSAISENENTQTESIASQASTSTFGSCGTLADFDGSGNADDVFAVGNGMYNDHVYPPNIGHGMYSGDNGYSPDIGHGMYSDNVYPPDIGHGMYSDNVYPPDIGHGMYNYGDPSHSFYYDQIQQQQQPAFPYGNELLNCEDFSSQLFLLPPPPETFSYIPPPPPPYYYGNFGF